MSLMRFAICFLIFFTSTTSWSEDKPASIQKEPDNSAATETDAAEEQSKPAATKLIDRVEPTPYQDQLADLELTLDPETERVQLGDTEDKFPALFRPYQGEIEHGAVLLISDESAHHDWKISTHPLRMALSAAGWNTLSIPSLPAILAPLPERTLPSLKLIRSTAETNPAPPETTPPEQNTANNTAENSSSNNKDPKKAEPATEKAKTTAPKEVSSDRQEKYIARDQAAIQWLSSKNIRRIIILGHGKAATWAADLALNMQKAAQNVRLVMIDAKQSKDISAPLLVDILPEIEVTIIEIYSTPPTQQPEIYNSGIRQRKHIATRKQLKYHQIRMPFNSQSTSGQAWLQKRVRGIIQRLIVTAEAERMIDPAEKNQNEGANLEKPPGVKKPVAANTNLSN